jgi:fused signal recognition particle receptor
LSQALQFDKAVSLSGLVVTKLDGTARGGIIFNIAKTLKCPIRFIGMGEGIEDLRSFSARPFVEALFSDVSKLEG